MSFLYYLCTLRLMGLLSLSLYLSTVKGILTKLYLFDDFTSNQLLHEDHSKEYEKSIDIPEEKHLFVGNQREVLNWIE